LTNTGIKELWEIILDYFALTKESGYFETHRKEQDVIRMHNTIGEYLNNSFYNHEQVKLMVPDIEQKLYEGSITSYKAALNLLDKYFDCLPD
jgi:LAO/AO transport system kinase